MRRLLQLLSHMLSIVILQGILFAYAMFQGGFVSWFLFYSFLPIFLYHLVLLIYPMKRWQIARTISQRFVAAGDGVEVTISVKRSLPLPIYYAVVEDRLPKSLAYKDTKQAKYRHLSKPERLHAKRFAKQLVFIGFKKNMKFTYLLDELPRGEHHLTALRIKISDVLGFIKKEHLFSVADSFYVYPNERQLALPQALQSFTQGVQTANLPQFQQTNSVAGVRDYAPGDRLSWIDWKQSAKSNQIMTKEFEAERGTQIALVLDGASVNGENRLAFEATVELTLSLYSEMSRTGIEADVLLLSNEARYFPAASHQMRNNDLIAALVRMKPDGESLAHSLMKERGKLAAANVVIVLTTVLDDATVDSLIKIQRQLQLVFLYVRSEHLIEEKQKGWLDQLRGVGVKTQVFSENQLSGTKTEVRL